MEKILKSILIYLFGFVEKYLMHDFLYWLRIYAHDLINKITCVIIYVDSLDISFEDAIKNPEIMVLLDKIDDFFVEQSLFNVSSSEDLIYRDSVLKFFKNQWSKCKSSDDMYFCCRLLHIFQLVFLNDYDEEATKEYLDMLSINVEIRNTWNGALYLVILCFIVDHNSDNFVTIDEDKLFFNRDISLESNIIRSFVKNILKKNILFEYKSISIY